MNATRDQRIEQALFCGHSLTLDNPAYGHAVRTFTEVLVRSDLADASVRIGFHLCPRSRSRRGTQGVCISDADPRRRDRFRKAGW